MADIVVLGGGPGGVSAAITARRLGASVTLVERGNLGGVCVHAGCIPSGAYHRTVETRHDLARAPAIGVTSAPAAVDWAAMNAWVSSVVETVASRTRSSLDFFEVEMVSASGTFTGRGRVEAGSFSSNGAPVVVATGARSFVPEFPGDVSRVLDNDGAMALGARPDSIVILGCGRFSIEWADFFCLAGAQVIVVAADDSILPDEDPDVAGFLQIVLEERGVRFMLQTPMDEVAGNTVMAAGEKLEADAVLAADTRAPNVGDLGLSQAGIELGDHGGIAVDAHCRASAQGVFAAGDVTGPPWLSNRASAQGAVAAANALGENVRLRPERIPRSVNTRPEIAAVGLTEAQAAERGMTSAVLMADLAANFRAITLGDPRGAFKLVVDEEFGEILGAHMVGMGAVEVIAQVVTAMEAEVDYRDLGKAHHVHPSLAELVRDAVVFGT